MYGWIQDLRYALRLLAKEPAYTTVAALTMALGVGATTAIFSVVQPVLLAPLPLPESDRLVRLYGTVPEQGVDDLGLSPADFRDLAERVGAFSGAAAHSYYGLSLDRDGRPRDFTTLWVTPRLFETLGVRPLHGRIFLPDEGGEKVVLLSHELWQQELGADPTVVGAPLNLDGEPWTVVGVMPAGFDVPAAKAWMWIPSQILTPGFAGEGDPPRRSRYNQALARLAPGVTLEAAQSEVDSVARALAAEYPETNTGHGIRLVPLKEVVVGSARPALVAVQVAVGLVLLIACANVASLTLSRGAYRRHEIAARSALGAPRWRLLRLLMVESTVLALLGGGLGLLLASWGVDLLVAATPPDLPRLAEVGLNLPVLAFSSLLVLATGPLVGLVPAIQLSRVPVTSALAGGERGAVGTRGAARTRSLLTVGELALSLVLLVGAGLLLKSFVRLNALDYGFDHESTLAVQLFVYGPKYQEPAAQRIFFDELFAEVGALPGVEAVGAANALPLSPLSFGESQLQVEGRAEPEADLAGYRIATPGYFATMGRRIVAGRDLSRDDRPDGLPAVVVNESAARRYFPGGEAVGGRLRTLRGEGDWTTVVGVVADARHESLEIAPRPEVFFPFAQQTTGSMGLVVRTAGDPAAMLEEVQEKVWAVDPAQPVFSAFTLADSVEKSTGRRRFYTFLVGLFAAVALLLACVGIYGVISYSVARRTREIGVRMVLGARAGTILGMVLREGALLLAVGLGLGLALGLAASRLAESLLFEVESTDPGILLWASLALAAVALAACALPARRAAAIAPSAALREG